jgi:hypothetical protein
MREAGQMRERKIDKSSYVGQKRGIRHKRDVGKKRKTQNLIKDMGKRERWGS